MNDNTSHKQQLRSLQNRWYRRRLLTKAACLSCLLVLLIACVQWLPLINAKWSIRDDHRFVGLMGDAARVDFHTFLEQINPPDYFYLGSTFNRPVYNIVHASWMFLLGNSVRSWQVAKIVAFGMVVVLSFFFLHCWLDLTAASILSIFIATLPGWEDVVPGHTSELFGIAGLMLYFTGISFLLQGREISGERLLRPRGVVPLFLVSLGAAVGVGSKENLCFTILFTSFCFLGWSLLIRNRKLLLAQLVPIALGATIAFFIWLGLSHNGGRAVYGQTFNLWQIVYAALREFLNGGLSSWLPFGLAAFYGIRSCIRKNSSELPVALFEMMLIGAFLLNAGFYEGFGLVGRYAFPVNLIPVLAILPVICELERTESSQFSPLRKLAFAAVFVCALFPSIHGFSINLDRSFTYRRETRKFISQIDKVSKELLAHPEQPTVFESFSPIDFEPLVSVDIFLRSRKANNERFVKLNYSSSQVTNNFHRFIASLTEHYLIGPGCRFESFTDIGTRPFFRITISAPKPDKEATGNFYPIH